MEATPLPPPVSTKRTEGGYVEWTNLQLSPPPPLYRPFVAMDEEKKSSKKMSLKDKFGQYRFLLMCGFSLFSSSKLVRVFRILFFLLSLNPALAKGQA